VGWGALPRRAPRSQNPNLHVKAVYHDGARVVAVGTDCSAVVLCYLSTQTTGQDVCRTRLCILSAIILNVGDALLDVYV
jgi:hypothetical protein